MSLLKDVVEHVSDENEKLRAALVAELSPARWPKRCACGRVHSASAWAVLPYIGRLEDDVEAIELRNCACGSTIAQLCDNSGSDSTKKE